MKSNRIHLIFAIVIFSSIFLTSISGRRYPKFDKNNGNRTEDEDAENDSSSNLERGQQGIEVYGVPDWHGTGWIYRPKPKMVTYLIRLGKDYILAPTDFAGLIMRTSRHNGGKRKNGREYRKRNSSKGAHWIFSTPLSFDGRLGIQADADHSSLVQDVSTFKGVTAIAKNKFMLFKQTWDNREKNKNPHIPTLEKDRNKSPQDCWVYFWSHSPTPDDSTAGKPPVKNDPNIFYYSKFNVELAPKGCDSNGVCRFHSVQGKYRGQICDDDRLAPIICEGKLAYVTYDKNPIVNSGCNFGFDAVHTADIIQDADLVVPDLKY